MFLYTIQILYLEHGHPLILNMPQVSEAVVTVQIRPNPVQYDPVPRAESSDTVQCETVPCHTKSRGHGDPQGLELTHRDAGLPSIRERFKSTHGLQRLPQIGTRSSTQPRHQVLLPQFSAQPQGDQRSFLYPAQGSYCSDREESEAHQTHANRSRWANYS